MMKVSEQLEAAFQASQRIDAVRWNPAEQAIERLIPEIKAMEERLEAAEAHVMNLLARIFRDGGHRAYTFATLAEAVEQADIEAAQYIVGYSAAIARAEAAERMNGELRDQIAEAVRIMQSMLGKRAPNGGCSMCGFMDTHYHGCPGGDAKSFIYVIQSASQKGENQ